MPFSVAWRLNSTEEVSPLSARELPVRPGRLSELGLRRLRSVEMGTRIFATAVALWPRSVPGSCSGVAYADAAAPAHCTELIPGCANRAGERVLSTLTPNTGSVLGWLARLAALGDARRGKGMLTAVPGNAWRSRYRVAAGLMDGGTWSAARGPPGHVTTNRGKPAATTACLGFYSGSPLRRCGRVANAMGGKSCFDMG